MKRDCGGNEEAPARAWVVLRGEKQVIGGESGGCLPRCELEGETSVNATQYLWSIASNIVV